MSYEKAIKEKHMLEDRVVKFLKLIASMSDNEIEISLARLADRLLRHSNEPENRHVQFKGDLIKEYFDLRKLGQLKQIKLRRVMSYFISEENFPSHSKIVEYEKEKERRRLEWKRIRGDMPLVKRLFIGKKLPLDQFPPSANVSQSEMLVHFVVEYRLVNIDKPIPNEVLAKKFITYASS